MKKSFLPKGNYVGKGTLTISMLEELLPIWARITLSEKVEGEEELLLVVEYQILGTKEEVVNRYTFSTVVRDQFAVALENTLWGKAFGKGYLDEKGMNLEFTRGNHGFEGFETIEYVDEGALQWNTEYLTDEGVRSSLSLRAVKCVENMAVPG